MHVVGIDPGMHELIVATDADDIDWTALSEVSVPTPAATLTTSWNKALDFSGSSERLLQVADTFA